VREQPRDRMEPWLAWGPILMGILVLYLPTYIDLWRAFWKLREGSAAPVMLLLAGWLIWRERRVLLGVTAHDARVVGVLLFTVGAVLYVIGRSQSFYQLEVGSQIPLLLGIVAIMLGRPGLRRLAFPIFLLVFLVPVPGSIIDQLLLPLKEWVSDLVDEGLHLAGYPIARSGVVLSIGPYSLLVADACSGLHSLVALSGVGLFYSYLVGNRRFWMKASLLASVLPIAFLSNVLRVAGLTLVTYYFGESAGVGFHDLAGYLEILLAFGCLFGVEHLLLWLHVRHTVTEEAHA
jgi:exosortase B